jgi:hypothetical protein
MFSFNVNLSLNWNGRFMTTWHGMTNCRPIGYFDPAMDPEWCPFTSLFEIPFGFTMVHPAWLMIFMDLYGSLWIQVVSHRNGASLSTRNGCPTRYNSPISPLSCTLPKLRRVFPLNRLLSPSLGVAWVDIQHLKSRHIGTAKVRPDK